MKNKQWNINVNGKEYLDIMKYEDSKKFKLSPKVKQALPYFIFSFIGLFIIGLLLHSLFYIPPQHTTLNFTWEGVLMFLVICAGIGWACHGTGFLLVRR